MPGLHIPTAYSDLLIPSDTMVTAQRRSKIAGINAEDRHRQEKSIFLCITAKQLAVESGVWKAFLTRRQFFGSAVSLLLPDSQFVVIDTLGLYKHRTYNYSPYTCTRKYIPMVLYRVILLRLL